jgi:Family of unknown function (DUF6152)
MRSRMAFGFIVAAFCVAAGAGRPVAHHSFSAEFDEKNCAELTGTLVGVDWQNPHPYFFVEGKNLKGQVAKMTFQTSSIANMTRGGTPRGFFMENMNKAVTVRACASINGTDNRFAASWLKVGDGPLHRTGQDVERIFGSNN